MIMLKIPSVVGSRHTCFISCSLVFLAQLGVTLCLPSLPSIESELDFGAGKTGSTLLLYFIGVATPQLLWGALADRVGRRQLLLLSLVVFSVASLVAALTSNPLVFIAARFFQGFGAGGGAVVGRMLIRDISEGKNLAKNFSLLSISFICALGIGQFFGGVTEQYFHWSFGFLFLFFLGVILMIVVSVSPLPNRKGEIHVSTTSSYIDLLKMKSFMFPMLAGALGYGALVIFYQKGPYIFQQMLELSAKDYGDIGLLVGSAYGLGSLVVKKSVGNAGVQKLMVRGLGVIFFAGTILALSGWLCVSQICLALLPPLLIVINCAVAFGQALLFPASMAAALDSAKNSGPYATALCSFLQQMIAVMIGGISLWFGQELLTSLAIALITLSAAGMLLITNRAKIVYL